MTSKNLLEHTVVEFLETAGVLERQMDRALAYTRGISFSEYRLLSVLSSAPPNGLPRVDLAKSVGLTASAVTRALKPLEKMGYVVTEKSARDARQSLAKLTSGGDLLVKEGRGVLRDTIAALPVAGMSAEALATLRATLSEWRSSNS